MCIVVLTLKKFLLFSPYMLLSLCKTVSESLLMLLFTFSITLDTKWLQMFKELVILTYVHVVIGEIFGSLGAHFPWNSY